MAGGVFAGVIGPQLVTHTMDLWLPMFAATFVAQAAVAALCGIVLIGVRLPMPTAAERAGGRPIGVIARQPRFITAVICGTVRSEEHKSELQSLMRTSYAVFCLKKKKQKKNGRPKR